MNNKLTNIKKYQNTIYLSLQKFAKALFLFSLRTYNALKRKWKQRLYKILEGKNKEYYGIFYIS